MKTKHLKIGLAFVAASLTSVFFNNFSFNDWHHDIPAVESVHEASRISHAKELLGGSYKGSGAQKLEGQEDLNQLILGKVEAHLPPKFKAQARTVTRTVITESAKYGLDPVFILAIIKTESKFNPLAVGRHGEVGLMQIKPDTAKWIAHKYNLPWNGEQTLNSPCANIKIGLAYMNYLRGKFDKKALKYISAYNMGPTNVRRLLAKNIEPAEYNSRVMKHYGEIYARLSNAPSFKEHLIASF